MDVYLLPFDDNDDDDDKSRIQVRFTKFNLPYINVASWTLICF